MSDARIEAIRDVLVQYPDYYKIVSPQVEVVELAKKILDAVDAVGPQQLRVGDILGRTYSDGTGYDGFCGGEFGRDSYDLKRVIEIAADYVVCRNERGEVEFYSGNPDDLVEYVLPESAATSFSF